MLLGSIVPLSLSIDSSISFFIGVLGIVIRDFLIYQMVVTNSYYAYVQSTCAFNGEFSIPELL